MNTFIYNFHLLCGVCGSFCVEIPICNLLVRVPKRHWAASSSLMLSILSLETEGSFEQTNFLSQSTAISMLCNVYESFHEFLPSYGLIWNMSFAKSEMLYFVIKARHKLRPSRVVWELWNLSRLILIYFAIANDCKKRHFQVAFLA